MRIADLSIRRPVFAVVLIGGLSGLGLLSLPKLGVDLFPRIEFPLATVTTLLPGAAPSTVESEVSQVLEEAVSSTQGIRSLRSYSSESLSRVVLEFELDQDPRLRTQDVRDKVFAARGLLPEKAEPPVVERLDADSEPILAILAAGPLPLRELTEWADKRLRRRLEQLPGVGSIEIVGGRAREIRIWLDPTRLSGYGLAVDHVIQSLEAGHVELPAGLIENEHHAFAVKALGRIRRVEDFGALVVARRAGRAVHLRDVARVEDGMAEERTLASLGGERGVAVLVRRQSGENLVAVASRVKAEVDALAGSLPEGMRLVVAQDTSRFIEASVRDVYSDLAWGALLAVGVVLIFLRSARATLIIATAIPASLIASFALFYFLDLTLNNMTLMALSLSIGMLIDDAIVVLENVWRHVEAGERSAEAASRATDEVGLAVIAATAAICAVFVPIAFMGSVVGKFFREFGLVVACAVSVSGLVAVTLTPMLCARALKPPAEPRGAGRWLERFFGALERRYRSLLAWGLDHRGRVAALALGSVGLAGLAARAVPVEFLPVVDRSEFNVSLELPLGSPLPATHRAAQAVAASLLEEPLVSDVFVRAGGGATGAAHEARLYVKLAPKQSRRESQASLMRRARARIAALDLPLEDFAVEDVPWLEVAGGAGQWMVNYAVRGPDLERVAAYAEQIAAFMRRAGGFTDVASSYESGRPEIALGISRERASDLGVDVARIGRSVAALLGGLEVATFEDGGERYDVRLQLHPRHRSDPRQIGLVNVRADDGRTVSLANLVQPRFHSGPVQIDRDDRARVVTLRANLDGKALGDAVREVESFAAALGMPAGYELAPIGNVEAMKETLAAIAFAFAVSLLAIYMVLAAQFDSFVHPATILLSAPLSFVGAFSALWVCGLYLDMMTQIGLLMLTGLVMKNGILLVDYANTVRARGAALRDAVLEAGPARLRPVLMTAVSTIFGMIPVTIARGDGAEWRSSMGVIVIGGMVASTALTLLVVPVAYTWMDDVRGLPRRIAAPLRRLARSARIEPPARTAPGISGRESA